MQAAPDPQNGRHSASLEHGKQLESRPQNPALPVVFSQEPCRPEVAVHGTDMPPQAELWAPAWQPPVSCARHRFFRFLPRQTPEQHWVLRLHLTPTTLQPSGSPARAGWPTALSANPTIALRRELLVMSARVQRSNREASIPGPLSSRQVLSALALYGPPITLSSGVNRCLRLPEEASQTVVRRPAVSSPSAHAIAFLGDSSPQPCRQERHRCGAAREQPQAARFLRNEIPLPQECTAGSSGSWR